MIRSKSYGTLSANQGDSCSDVYLSASDTGLSKIGLRWNTMECYSVRPLPLTVASQDLDGRDNTRKSSVQRTRMCGAIYPIYPRYPIA